MLDGVYTAHAMPGCTLDQLGRLQLVQQLSLNLSGPLFKVFFSLKLLIASRQVIAHGLVNLDLILGSQSPVSFASIY